MNLFIKDWLRNSYLVVRIAYSIMCAEWLSKNNNTNFKYSRVKKVIYIVLKVYSQGYIVTSYILHLMWTATG